MKNLIGFTLGLVVVSLVAFFTLPANATMVVRYSLDQTVEKCGENSFWIEGEVTAVQPTIDSKNLPATVVTIQGTLLKVPKDRNHLYFGSNWITGNPGDQVSVDVKFYGLPSTNIPGRFTQVPTVGDSGVFGLNGPGPGTANSGFCGTAAQGYFAEETDAGGARTGNLQVPLGTKSLGLQNMQITGNTRAMKSLGTLKNIGSGNSVPKGAFVDVLNNIISDKYPGLGVPQQ